MHQLRCTLESYLKVDEQKPHHQIQNQSTVQGQIGVNYGPVTMRFDGSSTIPVPPEQPWNVPYPRNFFFTGREDLLSRLQKQLQTDQSSALSQPQAFSGLGGIGKTQIAVQYAHKHRDDYQAVLWTRAESHEALTSSFVEIAVLLDLPAKDAQDQTITVQAVRRWLQDNHGWLLILDNADEPKIVREFLPTKFNGHILLTTRAQALGGLAQRIEVETFTPELGALFLLRRATMIGATAAIEKATSEDREVAMEISKELGGLALALDQAGAYVEEVQCSLSDYLSLYRTRRAEVLKERGGLVGDHPDSVATTWSLSFERVAQQSTAAADLLRFCAFLAPDAIPEEIITAFVLPSTQAKKPTPLKRALLWLRQRTGRTASSSSSQHRTKDNFVLGEAIGVLRAYSLIRRDTAEKTLSVHRLVQAVLRDEMPDDEAKMWAERAVRAVNAVFPSERWLPIQPYLPHALNCTILIKEYSLIFPEVSRLLDRTATYLQDAARYEEAEPLYVRALKIREQQLGPDHPDTATSLNNLASLYYAQDKYEQAESLQRQALLIREQALGPDYPDTAVSLGMLAQSYIAQSKYTEAEPLLQRAMAIFEQKLGPQHPHTAICIIALAGLYDSQGKYDEAEPLSLRALAINEKALGPLHPELATSLNNLASLYDSQGKYDEAEPLSLRALAINEKALGPLHPRLAASLNNLASLYYAQDKYEQAEPLLVRALSIKEQQLGALHPNTARSLNNLASLYYAQPGRALVSTCPGHP